MDDEKRRASTMLIDNDLLVDVSIHCIDFAKRTGIDLSGVTDLFITHSHVDHYQKSKLFELVEMTSKKINLWCHEKAVVNLGLTPEEAEKVNICSVKIMDKWEIGNTTVTALPANHLVKDSDEQPLHYIFERDGKSMMYGCDGGWFMARTWEYMRRIKLDGIVLDATVGDDAGNFRIGTHNSIPMLKIICAALLQNEVMTENGKIIGSHIAPSVYKMKRAEIEKALAEIGMIAAYDGMEIEI